MAEATEMGMNRTGMDMAPVQGKAMRENMDLSPTSQGSQGELIEARKTYLQSSNPIGNVPFPASILGIVKSTGKKLTGHRPEAFIDKLSERLIFERMGVRLYELLSQK